MGKPLVNRKKWTQDEFRILVVLLLTVIYPIFVSAFFSIFFFVLTPVLNIAIIGSHIYWLVVSLFWVILCAVILPCFRNTRASVQSAGLDFQEGPVYPTTKHAVQPFVKVEEVDEKKRESLLTNKSKDSRESIEKGMCEEKADKESLEKSEDNLGKSTASLEKGQITQSGEFLNECIDSLGPDKLQDEEAECEVHAEDANKDRGKSDDLPEKGGVDDADKYDEKKDTSDSSSDESDTEKEDNKVTEDNLGKEKTENFAEVIEPVVERREKDLAEAAPLQVEEGNLQESEILGEEQVTELDEAGPVTVRKPRPTIDTSRASGYYECSMPSPRLSSAGNPERNMVFMFVNPDIAGAEKDIIVDHEGEIVEEQEKEN